jgi:hypothetical protein
MAAWKQAERRLAALFGTRRRPLSGGNSGGGRDDAMHDRLFIENKWRKKHSTWTLYRDTKEKATAEGKTPVIGLQEKYKSGILLVIHTDDLETVLLEYLKGLRLMKLAATVRDALQKHHKRKGE